jgi:hypothetical protein
MQVLLTIAAGAALVAAAPVKLAPADDKPPALVGAAARAKHGPDPMTKPAEDVGAAEDPAPIATPPAVPGTTPKR